MTQEYEWDIANFKGVKHAALRIPKGKIAIVAGENAMGKSSIATAAAATAAQARMPCGQPLRHSALYVYRGAKEGTVFYRTPDNRGSKIVWSKDGVQMGGTSLDIGLSAAGLEKLSSMKSEERSLLLTDILKAKVTQNDFLTALSDSFGQTKGQETCDQLWREVDTLGFDPVLKSQIAEGIILKRKWQEATGKPKWSVSALDWMPEVWEQALALADPVEVAKVVTAAQKAVEDAIRTEAVMGANVAELQAKKNAIPEIEKRIVLLRDQASALGQSLLTRKLEANALPKAEQHRALNCPECNANLILDDGMLKKTVTLPDAEIENRKLAIDAYNEMVAELQKQLSVLESDYRENQLLLKLAKEASAKLDQLEKEKAQLTASGGNVDTCRLALQEAERRLKAKNAKLFADAIHQQIMDNAKLQEILAPEGLRRTKLAQLLVTFEDEYLQPLCAAAAKADPRWQPVHIDADLNIQFGVGFYNTISGSERFRTDVTLQVALAMKQKQPLVIIDEADELDGKGRGGLMCLLTHSKLTALVCMMVSRKEQVPKASLSNCDAVAYWIEDGILQELYPKTT